MSIITDFVIDLINIQDKVSFPLKGDQIISIANAWRGISKRDAYYKKMEDSKHQRRLNAYNLTSSDFEAARMLGITDATFRRWRNWNGLKTKGIPGVKGKKQHG